MNTEKNNIKMRIEEINIALAKAMGLKTKNLREFTVRAKCGEVPTVMATYIVHEKGQLDLINKHFRIVGLKEVEQLDETDVIERWSKEVE